MKLHRRFLGSLAYSAGGFDTLRLPRNYVYSALQFCLIADIDRTADAGDAKDSAPAQLVQTLEVVVNGKNTIKRMDYETLHRRNQMYHGVRPFIDAANLAGYGALDDDISKVSAQFDFELPPQGPWTRGVDCLLDARGMSSLDLNVRWGQPNDIMNDAYGGVVTVNSAKLLVWTLERVNAPVVPYALWKEYQLLSHTIAGAGVLTVDLPVNTTYEAVTIKTHADGDQVNTIIPFGLALFNPIRLYSGSEVYLDIPAGAVQINNRNDCQIEVPELTLSAAAINHARQEFRLEGYYHLPFVHDGLLSEMLDATRLGDLKVDATVAVPGDQNVLDVYLSEIILPATPAEAA
ncbi:MAG: hypothetical protein PHR30_18680 [Gallionellaceae bacterium]|nr:hypothetical protein [Gallionellaceae bacterium]